MDTREIRKMSRAERLAAMEALWDSWSKKRAKSNPRVASRHPGRENAIESGKAEFISRKTPGES
jgi:hypothetical protein